MVPLARTATLAPALSHLVRLTELQAGNRLWGFKGMAQLS